MSSKKNLFTVITLIATLSAFAGDGDYAVSKIPEALMRNADVVKRMEEYKFEVLALGKSRYYHKYVITVLNENGDKFAREVISYNKLREIKSFEGRLYDADGKEIKKMKKSDIKDLSAVDDNSLIDDNRIKLHSFYHRLYPYTIEYETEEQYNFNMFFPIWSPFDGERMAVEQSSFQLIAPSDFTVRYKSFVYKGDPVKKVEKGIKEYRWEVKNMSSIELEYASPNWTEIVPIVFFAPTQFEVEKYKGDMSSWQSLGTFIYNLNKGRDILPDNIKQKVHALTDNISDPHEKIKVLYKFLQSNTRYISVQLGIGGWQTYDATYVGTRNYGDCKALSNYMYSLLKEAGIKSNYTLINSGGSSQDYLNDFPNSRFNHAILCVPLKTDTVWLECTSSSKPAGYLGGDNSNRQVLLVDETGGRVARTPKYGLKENTQVRVVKASVDNNGLLTAEINTEYKAVQQERRHAMIHTLSKEKQLENLKKNIDLPHYDIVDFKYNEIKQTIPLLQERIALKADNYASLTGKRLFIIPNIISRSYYKIKQDSSRKYPISLQFEFHDIDSATIDIPSGYEVEAKPTPVEISNAFGKYKTSVEVVSGKIIYYREMIKYSGEFPANKFNDLAKFYDQIYKADRSRVVLVKKD